jgi:hypothetical protein
VPERLLREEMRRRRINCLFDAAARLAAQDGAALTPEEIEAEIEIARRKRHAGRSS